MAVSIHLNAVLKKLSRGFREEDGGKSTLQGHLLKHCASYLSACRNDADVKAILTPMRTEANVVGKTAPSGIAAAASASLAMGKICSTDNDQEGGLDGKEDDEQIELGLENSQFS